MANRYYHSSPTLLLGVVLFILIPMGCVSPGENKPVISEGIIHYNISYPANLEQKSFSFLLPKKMDLFFNPNRVRASFKGGLGLYALDFISNHLNDSSITLLKVLNQKKYVPASQTQQLFIFKNYPSTRVTLHKDTVRKINGFDAHRATITTPSEAQASIDVWYTRQIKMKKTNKNTPFAKIPGMMLEYNFSFNRVKFKLKAESVEEKILPDATFMIPAGYKETTIKEVEEMISGLLN